MKLPGCFMTACGGGRAGVCPPLLSPRGASPREKTAFLSNLIEFFFVFGGIFLITVIVSRLAAFSGEPPPPLAPPADAPAWAGRFFFCLWTGYFEETLFRKYLPEKLAAAGMREAAAVAVSTALFACLHEWEGFWGVCNAVLAALFLCFCYRRRGSLHIIALAHAAHNFAISVFASS
jgi:membrane protease YdiL (CAAX protease family)